VNAGSSSPKGKTIQISNVSNKTASAKKLGIFNGDKAPQGKFPYAVFLYKVDNTGAQSTCTGVLFAPNFVLTAGKKQNPRENLEYLSNVKIYKDLGYITILYF
jgi:hypothetical protein